MRKMILALSLVALGALVGACGKKEEKKSEDKGGSASGFNCESVAKKNGQCAGELATAILDTLGDRFPQERKEKIANSMKDRMSGERWVATCKKRWESDSERHKEQKAAMEKCFAIADCKEYSKCFFEASGMGRGKHRGRLGRHGSMGAEDAMGEAPMDAMGEAPADAMGEAPMDAMGEAPMDAMGEAPMDAMQ